MSTQTIETWTQVLKTPGGSFSTQSEEAHALTTGLDGSIYVSGYTSGYLDGQTNSGSDDAFLTKYSADGTKAWTKMLTATAAKGNLRSTRALMPRRLVYCPTSAKAALELMS